MVSLLLHTVIFSVYLSATSGYQILETVIKIERKPKSGLKHIGRNFMRVWQMRQGAIFPGSWKYNHRYVRFLR